MDHLAVPTRRGALQSPNADMETFEWNVRDGLAGSTQELVAVALTMMSRYAMSGDPGEQAESAATVREVLRALGDRSDLDAELRRLCLRLQNVWAQA